MDYLNDCNLYIKDNNKFIKDISSNLPNSYYRFIAPLKIINYVNELNSLKRVIDEDVQNILENAFSYFYESVELLKLYYNNYFQKSFSIMKKYDDVINYILYLEDISFIIDKDDIYNQITQKIKELESILITKNNFTENSFTNIETILLNINTKKGLYSQQEIFEMVAEELGL